MQIFFFFLVGTLMLAGCDNSKYPVINADLEQIRVLSPEKVLYPYDANSPRFETIRDAALIYASQASLRYHYHQINQLLLAKDAELNRIFNFQPLILKKDVVPPVIALSGQSVEQLDDTHLIIADRTFKILKNGFFSSSLPSWKGYLIAYLPEPHLPEKTFLPQDSVEKEIWSRYAEEGWYAGKEQAVLMFQNNLASLSQDYLGMVNFHRLYQQGLISAPVVEEVETGVTISQNQMNINQKIITIIKNSLLEHDHRNWHSYVFFVD